MVIVDTSVLFEALVPGLSTVIARELLSSQQPVAAPDLILVEIAGALTRAVRRGLLSSAFARRAFLSTTSVIPTLDRVEPLLARGFELSLEIAHPLADCVFLAHAEARLCPLVTADGPFARKVASTPYTGKVIVLSDWRT